MNRDKNKSNLKIFFIKLIAITFSIIVIINITYNLIFAEKLENINKLLTINNKENIEQIKNKIRIEIKNGLSKEKIFNEEDKMLLYQLYLKIKNEFKEIEKNYFLIQIDVKKKTNNFTFFFIFIFTLLCYHNWSILG